jgi:hypothetical protein
MGWVSKQAKAKSRVSRLALLKKALAAFQEKIRKEYEERMIRWDKEKKRK